MTIKERFCSIVMAVLIFYAMASNAMAADYSFTTDAPQDYYGDTSYEAIYGSQYNYGGPNVVDFQVPELEYGILSITQTGIMEPSILRGLQPSVATMEGEGGYGISADGATEIYGEGLFSASEPSLLSRQFLPADSVHQCWTAWRERTAASVRWRSPPWAFP